MICYHYCGLESFLSIVRHRTLRLCNLFFMNDYKEVTWFFDIARNVIEEYVEDESGSTEAEDNVAVLDLNRMLEREPFDHIYAACLSRKEDDLSQWRGYANDGRGIALGIDLDDVGEQAKCSALERVCVKYDKAEQRREAERILMPLVTSESSDCIDSSSSSSSSSYSGPARRLFRELARLAPCHKNPAFAGEEEVRLVVRTRVPPDKELDRAQFDREWFGGFPAPVQFFESRTGLVPFTTVRLPESAIRIVRFGPKFGGYANKAAVKLFCGKRLPSNQIEFCDSEASYR